MVKPTEIFIFLKRMINQTITAVDLTPYALKGIDYTKEEILKLCIQTINHDIVKNAIIVLCIIISTMIIKPVGLYFLNKEQDKTTYQYSIFYDLLNNLQIIDYGVMMFYLVWIIALSLSW